MRPGPSAVKGHGFYFEDKRLLIFPLFSIEGMYFLTDFE